MRNRTAGQLMLALGVGLLCGVFALGLLAFLDPGRLAGFSELVPGDSPPPEMGAYLVAMALLWVIGGATGRILQYGLALARSERE
ncbi:MAG: hypothetical protein J7J17_00535 [Hadesarchaea archaeon]|nr:hypothetical protein [Hadesarchaea archaeon]